MMVYFEGGLRDNNYMDMSEYLYSLPYIKLRPPEMCSMAIHDHVDYEEYERLPRNRRHLCREGYIPIYRYKGYTKKLDIFGKPYRDPCGLCHE